MWQRHTWGCTTGHTDACECRTCSARNLTPFVGRSSSKVSPRMGLKGFQVRSLPPKGPMQKPATHASLQTQYVACDKRLVCGQQ